MLAAHFMAYFGVIYFLLIWGVGVVEIVFKFQRAPNPSEFAPTCTRGPKRPKQTCTNSRPEALICKLRTGTNLHKFAPPRGRHPSGGPTRGGGVQIRVGLEPAESYSVSVIPLPMIGAKIITLHNVIVSN